MIKVLIVEDSPSVQELLIHILESDPEVKVIGTANNGLEALEFIKNKKPDVITMDIYMPKMDGLEATRKIMESNPFPIVMISASMNPGEVEKSFVAINAGAIAVLEKPVNLMHPDYHKMAFDILHTVKAMSEVKVVKRWSKKMTQQYKKEFPKELEVREKKEFQVIGIGASTGGPLVLQFILQNLPKDFPIPILIVQHIASGFLEGFGNWLREITGFPVKVAEQNELIISGHAYIGPDDYHLGVNEHCRIILSKDKKINGLRPSVSCLFQSMANNIGRESMGILLTGMGSDGAEGLKLMKENGALTIAQDEKSSLIFGMPKEAVKLNAAVQVLSPDKIIELLKSLESF